MLVVQPAIGSHYSQSVDNSLRNSLMNDLLLRIIEGEIMYECIIKGLE